MKPISRKESEDIMKKILVTLVAILALLCGCQANENTNASDYGDDISKAQEIAVSGEITAISCAFEISSP